MVVSPAVNSLPTGVNYDQISAGGCNCHAAAPNAAVMVTLDGLPEEYNMSETYQVTISFTGGPSAEGNANLGGFNLWASGGEITTLDATVQSNGPSEVTHTEAGNDYTSWTVEWIAPSHGRDVDFVVHVNSVNGDGNAGPEDQWNKLTLKVAGSLGPGLEEADPYKVLGLSLIHI